MPIFRPKSKPVLRSSRIAHFLAAATATWYGGHLFGYEGAVCTGFGAIVAGFGWEVANRFMPGNHRFGDAIDFWAFVLGATVAGIGWLCVPA